jgi:hypothetical protein
MSDLFPASDRLAGFNSSKGPKPKGSPKSKPSSNGNGKSYKTAAEAVAGAAAYHKYGKPSASWGYVDELGSEIGRVFRYELPGGDKACLPAYRDAGGLWHGKAFPEPRPLYHRDRLAAADFVVVNEGERCADLVCGLGLVGTTSAGGSGAAGKSDWSVLAGKRVAVIPDNDDSGRKYAADVCAALGGLKPGPCVRVLDLSPKNKGDDIAEWLERAPDSWDPDECGAELKRLFEAASDWVPPAPSDPDGLERVPDDELGMVKADSVKPEPVRWLWQSRIAIGKLNIVAGEGKQGKTQMALAIAAAVTRGGALPGGIDQTEAGEVVILSAEDDPADTLAPRLIALDAVMSKITFLRGDYFTRDRSGQKVVHPVAFRDIDYWREVFRRRPGCRLLLVDPLPSFLGRGVNDHKNAEIREALTGFLGLVGEVGVALLAITHLSKGIDPKRPASARIVGSIAYANLARSIHFVGKDPENPKRRLFMQSDNTMAASDLPAVAFTLEPREVAGGDVPFSVWVPVFQDGGVEVDVNDVVNAGVNREKSRRGPAPSQVKALAEYLADYLARNGPSFLGEIGDGAGAAGFLGEKRWNPKTEREEWSKFTTLYRAMEFINTGELGERASWRVLTPDDDPGLREGRRVKWSIQLPPDRPF